MNRQKTDEEFKELFQRLAELRKTNKVSLSAFSKEMGIPTGTMYSAAHRLGMSDLILKPAPPKFPTKKKSNGFIQFAPVGREGVTLEKNGIVVKIAHGDEASLRAALMVLKDF